MEKRSIKEYRIWKAMKARCYAPSQTRGYYQKDGIKVCERWRNSFDNFINDMGRMPDETYSIERLDIKGDYCLENCTWIPMSDQPKNRRTSIMVTYKGQTKCLKDWCRQFGIKYTTVYMRIYRGSTVNEALGIIAD